MNKLILTNSIVSASAITRKLDGEDHLVVPVIAIKEGVLNKVFYSKEAIQSYANTWNGVSVPVDHPERDGFPVSANSVDLEESTNIGRFYDVKYEDGKLKGNIWINIGKAARLGYQNIVDHFKAGKMMEVSTGLYPNLTKNVGEFAGKAYDFVADTLRPDHLALLPNSIGACSIEDGCGGMRLNKEEICGCGGNCQCDDNEPSNVEVNESNQTEVINMIDKEKIVGELIANASTQFKEDDKEVLMTFEESVLEKMKPVVNEAPEVVEVVKEVVTANTLTDEDMTLFNHLKANETDRQNVVRESVVSAYEHLSSDMVANMDIGSVEALAKGIKPIADFSARGGAGVQTNTAKVFKPSAVLLANVNEEGAA